MEGDAVLKDWKNIVKIQILPKLIYRFSKNSIKILAIFCGNRQAGSKFYMEKQKNYNSQNSSEKEGQSCRNHTTWC